MRWSMTVLVQLGVGDLSTTLTVQIYDHVHAGHFGRGKSRAAQIVHFAWSV